MNPEEMEDKLRAANEAYYMGESPIMTDAEFDALKRKLESVYEQAGERPAGSVLDEVGAPAPEGVKKHKHAVPMLSLSNAFDEADVQGFWKQVSADENSPVFVELKLDGLSLSLTYVDRALVRATTRGDGEVGEDMTSRVDRLADLPHVLNEDFPMGLLEIRGEVCLTHDGFLQVNAERERAGRTIFSNPRNAAAGLFRRDERETVMLDFFAYQVAGPDTPYFPSQSAAMRSLSRSGFQVSPLHAVLFTSEDAMTWYEDVSRQRSTLPVDIDGIVYKLDDSARSRQLGQRSTSPRWAIAHKFPPDRVWTKILGIDIQVGRTGTLAPVARLEPVTVGGVVVSNATLHNKDYIEGRDSFGKPIRDGVDIRVGDWVEVYRSGDVIPRIGSVDISKRSAESKTYAFPSTCPACSSPVMREPGEAAIKCTGSWQCPPQKLRAMVYAFSRDALNVDGVSESSLAQWVEWGWIDTPADVFALEDRYGHSHPVSLSRQHGWGKASAQKAFDALRVARKARLDRAIVALGMPFVGKASARLFAQKFSTFQEFRMAASTGSPELLEIEGVGEKMVEALKVFWSDADNAASADALIDCLEIENPLAVVGDDLPLTDWTVVFTGKIPGLGRDAVSEAARALGANVSGSVSSKTTVLVAGEGGGSKLTKAEKAGVAVWSPEQWEEVIAKVQAGLPVERPGG